MLPNYTRRRRMNMQEYLRTHPQYRRLTPAQRRRMARRQGITLNPGTTTDYRQIS